jgi:Calcineurin-like phosphoesterase/Purple acid Phosphatase, N-terminal domain
MASNTALLGTVALAFALGGGAAFAHDSDHNVPPWQVANAWPDRIIATFEADPAKSLAVSWRTLASVSASRAEIALASPDARFDLTARSVPAQTERVDLDKTMISGADVAIAANDKLPAVAYHSVRFDGLLPDTLYAYRVMGAEGLWSEWFQTRTASLSGPVRFIYMGDAQNGILSLWSRTIRAAYQAAPDARFMLHAGDLVNRARRDTEWAEWFKAGGFLHAMVPAIPVAGNHEYDMAAPGENERLRVLSHLWRPQFRLPVDNSLPSAVHETAYAVHYSADLDVFVLDSNQRDMAPQAAWLDAQLNASKKRWRIVTMHHPVFSSGRDRDNKPNRDLLLPILTRHSVDLVLQGHDHTYARGLLDASTQLPRRLGFKVGDALTTMFVNSVSGPKQYEFRKQGWDDYAPTGVKLERQGENGQFFQVIGINGNRLSYTAYTADGVQYDAAIIEKRGAVKRLIKNDKTQPPTRRFDNTAPYKSPDF